MKTDVLHHSLFYKRFAAFMLTVLLVAGTVPALAASEFAVVNNTTRLNLRSEPSANATWLGAYDKGTWIQVSDATEKWYAVVTPDGKTGYMSKNYLNKGITAATNVAIVKNPVATQFLNLRRSPSYTAQVLGIYYNNTPALVLGGSDGWYHVRVDGIEGYFRGEYITLQTMVGSDDIATIVTPNNTNLNLREGPGKQYATIRQFRGGRMVMVLARGNDWWRVSIDGYLGFMSTDFLQEGILNGGTTGGGSVTPPSGSGYALVKNPQSSQVLNLREEPNTSARVLGKYKNGTRLTMLAQGSEWCHVVVDASGTPGFMMTKYLDLVNLPSTPTRKISHPQGTFVNLRNGPSLTGTQVIAQMPHGTQVEILVPGVDWAKVKYNGYVGYAVTYFMD